MQLHIKRIAWIISIVKRGAYPSREEILREIEQNIYENFDEVSEQAGISESTFIRDKKEILATYDIEIKYSKIHKGYFIDYSEANSADFSHFNRLLEYVHKGNFTKLGNLIQLEKVNPVGLENINGVLHCIQHKQYIQFNYDNYNNDSIDSHKLAPTLIKEFKRRTYVVGKDYESGKTMWFSFDRMHDFKILDEKFNNIQLQNDYLNSCFGIVNYDNCEAQETLIKAYGAKARYIANHELHHTQVIVEQEKDFTIFSLKVKPTYDFIIELLSHSHQLEVLEPAYLRKEIKWRLVDTLRFYNDIK